MNIRLAAEKDIPCIMKLLSEVLTIHADERPDLFIHGTTKYTDDELKSILSDEKTPVFVAANDDDETVGYAFCVIQEPVKSNNMPPIKTLYIDDLCVDESCRGQHVGEALYEAVKAYAREIGCYHVTLNVWAQNFAAQKFYEKMGLKPMKTTMEEIL